MQIICPCNGTRKEQKERIYTDMFCRDVLLGRPHIDIGRPRTIGGLIEHGFGRFTRIQIVGPDCLPAGNLAGHPDRHLGCIQINSYTSSCAIEHACPDEGRGKERKERIYTDIFCRDVLLARRLFGGIGRPHMHPQSSWQVRTSLH